MELISKWHCCTLQRYELTTVVKLKLPGCCSPRADPNPKAVKAQTLHPRKQHLSKAYLNHSALWSAVDKVTLHATCKKLLTHMDLYSVFNLALCCFGNQTPQMIKSKKSIAAYKVMKGTLTGTCSQLRKQKQRNFSYKWCFLAPELQSIALAANITLHAKKKHQACEANHCANGGLGINNVFIWPELDAFDYAAFSQMPGLDVTFSYKNAQLFRRQTKCFA